MRILGEPRAAVAGQPFAGTLALRATGDIRLDAVRLEGSGWTIRTLEWPGRTELKEGQRLELRFEAVPALPEQPLVVVYEWQGGTEREPLDLSPRTIGALLRPRGVVRSRAGDDRARPGRLAPGAGAVPLEPVAPGTKIFLEGVSRPPGETPQRTGSRLILVYGRVVYYRVGDDRIGGDGATMPADSIEVRAYLDNGLPYNHNAALATTKTDSTGDFLMNVVWNGAYDPDIYVWFATEGDKVTVQPYSPFDFYYWWQSPTFQNVAADHIYTGDIHPDDEDDYTALHIQTNLMREWRWMRRNGYITPHVYVRWPYTGATNNSFYSTGDDLIYVADEQQWSDDTQNHEYGHHWTYHFGVMGPIDYCNSICDPATGCRHCDWCQEDEYSAWNEGFADWVADVVTRDYRTLWGISPLSYRDGDTKKPCTESSFSPNAGDACPCSPDSTEGFLTAVLRDIEDTSPAADPDTTIEGITDEMGVGAKPVLDVAQASWNGRSGPRTPREFLEAYAAAHPSQLPELWATAYNDSFQLDETPPGFVTNLISPSHNGTMFGGESSDATVDYTWTPAFDDMSGPDSLGICLTSNANCDGALIVDIADNGHWTSTPLTPGAWYLHVRARDRAKRWSNTQVTYGPIHIAPVEPVDLTSHLFAGWAGVVVPRRTNNATLLSCPAPDSLLGNSTSTYWNITGENGGGDPTPVAFNAFANVDGLFRQGTSFAAGITGTFARVNLPAINIGGGHHTFTGVYDGNEDIHEGSETNNVWGHQWVWTPLVLTQGVRITRGAGPDKEGGWDTVVDGSAKWFNSDGLRMFLTGYWNATWVYGTQMDEDYDCRMHQPSTGATNGFTTNLAWSTRPAGCLDAVIVNRNVTGNGGRDIGVLKELEDSDPFTGGYRAKHVISASFAFGDSVEVTIPQDEMMLLEEFIVSSTHYGWISITVRVVSGTGPVHVAYLDETFANGDLGDVDAETITDADGYARLDLDINTAGWRCILLYRDPKDGTAPITVAMEIENSGPDFTPNPLAGWYAPMVPRPAIDGTAISVPLPDTLYGNIASTYLNYSSRNESPAAGAAGMISRLYLDGVPNWAVSWGNFAAFGNRTYNSGTARTVTGGRHTMAAHLDDDLAYGELLEDNNVYGEQWVWSPLTLALKSPVTRSAPPGRTAGWVDVTSGEPRWYNCDGLRTPVFAPTGPDGYWGGVATIPGAASDVDVRLHELLDGAKTGFASNLVTSAWGIGQSDFTLANFRRTPFRALDAGVLLSTGAESYTVEVVKSVWRDSLPNNDYGPFKLPANRILDLHEFHLQAGAYYLKLENLAGLVDWGLSVHKDSLSFVAKSGSVVGGLAENAGAGADEEMTVDVIESGRYCVAVWKAGAASLGLSGDYRLQVFRQAADVPDLETAQGVDRLGRFVPNPLRAEGVAMFELAGEREVCLEVFDLRGARVRTLECGRLPAGIHRRKWDGRDAQGRPVPNGIYLLSLRADPFTASCKIVVLK